jgi:signal peptidase I
MEPKLAKNKTINIIGAIILSLFMPGLGHISCGKIKKGIILYILFYISLVLAFTTSILPIPPYNIIMAVLIFITFLLYVLIDSIIIAKDPINSLKLKPLAGYSLLVGILLLNSYAISPAATKTIKDNYIRAFKIPSGGMMPTLLIGDHIMVDKRIYKKYDPQKGDIIVFKYPKEPTRMFIKRIVGIGGDKIEINNKQLYINDDIIKEPYVIHNDPQIQESQRDNFGPFIVPKNSFFTLGDNRDQTYDSRFYGTVDRNDIKGKAMNIYFSWDKEVDSARWDRLGKGIK